MFFCCFLWQAVSKGLKMLKYFHCVDLIFIVDLLESGIKQCVELFLHTNMDNMVQDSNTGLNSPVGGAHLLVNQRSFPILV